MGYDLAAAILFVILTPLTVLGLVIHWLLTNKRRAALEEAWAAYASARSLELVPAEGEWPNRTNPAIVWSNERARFRLVARGTERHTATRIEIRPNASLLGTAVIAPNADGTFRIHERPEGAAARILDERVKRALLGFHQDDEVVVTHRRGRVTLAWPGGETNDARLDEARAVAEAIADALEAAFQRAPTAA